MPKEISNETSAPDFSEKSLAEILGSTPNSRSEYIDESKHWKDLQKFWNQRQPNATESTLPKLWLRPQDTDACFLWIYPGPDRKVEMTGKGCEFKLVPKTAEEKESDRLRREYEQTPEGQRELEERKRLGRSILK
ncbi:hypothetical protein KBI23_20055 [bacterium]|nr:hypothetical protein [bacterium]